MSFSYKKIQPSDITTLPYKANKKFQISNLSGSGITLYFGENTSFNTINYFDPENDDQTSNNEYKRLIFESIKHLFYKDYIETEGILLNSSSYYNYPQTTLYSGTFTTNLRRIPNITGSSFQGNNSIYNDFVVYDNEALYDEAPFDSNKGNLVNVISVDKNLYGSNIKPNTLIIDISGSYIRDDGEGNIFDYLNEDNYNIIIQSGIPTATYLGNIFYSLGIIVITNNDYICLFGSPPTTVNDYISYLNVSQSINFDILANDFSDCGGIDYSSLELIPLDDFPFPDSYIGNDNMLYIINNQDSYIPGNYRIGYTIKNNGGLQSNIGYIFLTILQKPLEISNLEVEKICYNTTGSVSFSAVLNYGVPEYSYSFNNSIYTQVSGFNNVEISGTISSSYNTLYIKDYIGTIYSSSINPYFDEIIYTLITSSLPSCNPSGGILNIESNQGTEFKLNGGPTLYPISSILYVPSGTNSIEIFDINGCSVSSSFIINNLPPYTYNLTTQSLICNNSGSITINNFVGNYSDITIQLVYPNTSSSIFNTSSLTINNLSSGTYYIQTYDGACSQTQSITFNSYPELIFTSSIDYYTNDCSTIINFNVTGGISPYIYKVITPTTIYTSDSSSIELYNDGLNGMYITSSIIDSNGCFKEIYQEVYGRKYIYSGSYCEDI